MRPMGRFGWFLAAVPAGAALAIAWTRPYPGIFFHSSGHPRVVNSSIG